MYIRAYVCIYDWEDYEDVCVFLTMYVWRVCVILYECMCIYSEFGTRNPVYMYGVCVCVMCKYV
jgi:hypothetical protein